MKREGGAEEVGTERGGASSVECFSLFLERCFEGRNVKLSLPPSNFFARDSGARLDAFSSFRFRVLGLEGVTSLSKPKEEEFAARKPRAGVEEESSDPPRRRIVSPSTVAVRGAPRAGGARTLPCDAFAQLSEAQISIR